jgi:hypothetical protein
MVGLLLAAHEALSDALLPLLCLVCGHPIAENGADQITGRLFL